MYRILCSPQNLTFLKQVHVELFWKYFGVFWYCSEDWEIIWISLKLAAMSLKLYRNFIFHQIHHTPRFSSQTFLLQTFKPSLNFSRYYGNPKMPSKHLWIFITILTPLRQAFTCVKTNSLFKLLELFREVLRFFYLHNAYSHWKRHWLWVGEKLGNEATMD